MSTDVVLPEFPRRHGCGTMLTRQRRKSHERKCPKLAKPPRPTQKCVRHDCAVVFVVHPKNPHKEFCSKKCWGRQAREDDKRRVPNAERTGAKPFEAVLDAADLEHLRMSAKRLVDAQVALQARRMGAAIEANRERSHALWLELLAPTRRAA